MNITQILQNIGLAEREIRIYLALLELGESTVLPIAKKAGIKRTYCYDILSSLSEKGLVSYIEKNGRRRYVAEDPAKIEFLLKERLNHFSQVLPELRSIFNQSGSKPKVRYYEGKEGLLSIYRDSLTAKELRAIGSVDHLYKYLGDFMTELGDEQAKRGIKIQELIVGTHLPVYTRRYRKPLQESRLLPAGTKLETDTMIYNDKLVLVSYGNDIHAIVIEGSSIVETHKTLFDLLWKAYGEDKK